MPLIAFLFFLAQSVSTSQISGTVKDQTGAVLPGAEVTATQVDTGAKRTGITDETGSYVLPNLPIGPYRLEVSLPGFRSYVQTGIVLQVNSNPVIHAVLQVGQVADSIEVQANAAMVETRSSGVAQVIDNQRVLELPLNGRQATELIFLAGMAAPGAGANLNSGVRNYPTVQISVAGGLDSGMTYLLDGGTHNDPYNNLNLPFPFPDALQEFKVETSALPAQYGHHSSAAINAVTKSGTNEFHGDAFEFLRNGALNARNAFALTRDSLKRNQFGGTLGGPIKENKLFFFGGYQGTTKRSAPTTNIAYVPTADMLAGDFTAVTAPSCNTSNRQITLLPPFVNNKILPSQFAAPSLALLKYLPTSADPCGKVQFGNVQNSDEHIVLGRIDYQVSDRHSTFYRYQLAALNQPTDYDGKNALTLSQGIISDRVHSLVVGDTHVHSAGLVTNFRATLNRAKIPKVSPKALDLSDLGVNMYVYAPKSPRITVQGNGFAVGGTSATESIYNTTSFQFSEDFSLIRGAHQIGAGVNFIHAELNGSSKLNATAPVIFNGQVTNLGLADFLLGKPSQFQQSNPTTLYYRSNYIGLYLQDAWKMTPRLTLNYGLRWDPFLPEYFKDGALAHFDRNLFDQGVRSIAYKKAPVGLVFPGDPGYPGKSVANHKLLEFAPRVGVAWDPHGNGSMSVRAAYGMFYNLPNLAHYSGLAQIPPFGSNVIVPFPASFANPWQSQPGGNPFPFALNSDVTFPANGQVISFPLDPRMTYQNQWNLSVQKQIGADWLVASNYVGSNVIHLWGGRELNPGVVISGSTTANLNTRRGLILQNPAEGRFYASVSEMDDGGTSTYHGLLLSVQRRRAHGMTVQGNYTWSHCIGDLGNTSLGVAGTNYMIPTDRHSSRGNCVSSDRRHLFNLSTVYEVPKFSNRTVQLVAGGWQFSGIVRLQTGEFLSVTTGVDSALTGAAAQRPNQVLADVFPENRTLDLWLNPKAFVAAPAGVYGNMGYNTIQGPGSIRIDMGVTRTFHVRERQSIQFRWEAFNLPNHLNPSNPTLSMQSSNFGRILSAADPRIMQAALKYVF